MVNRSSSEAEHTSMVAVTCELTWLIFLFDDLQVHIWDQLILYCDNQVALILLQIMCFMNARNTLNLTSHVAREKSQAGHIIINQVCSLQLAGMSSQKLWEEMSTL